MYHEIITIEATDGHFLEQKVEIKSPTSNLVMLLIFSKWVQLNLINSIK